MIGDRLRNDSSKETSLGKLWERNLFLFAIFII